MLPPPSCRLAVRRGAIGRCPSCRRRQFRRQVGISRVPAGPKSVVGVLQEHAARVVCDRSAGADRDPTSRGPQEPSAREFARIVAGASRHRQLSDLAARDSGSTKNLDPRALSLVDMAARQVFHQGNGDNTGQPVVAPAVAGSSDVPRSTATSLICNPTNVSVAVVESTSNSTASCIQCRWM